jgi:hypothetical protein
MHSSLVWRFVLNQARAQPTSTPGTALAHCKHVNCRAYEYPAPCSILTSAFSCTALCTSGYPHHIRVQMHGTVMVADLVPAAWAARPEVPTSGSSMQPNWSSHQAAATRTAASCPRSRLLGSHPITWVKHNLMHQPSPCSHNAIEYLAPPFGRVSASRSASAVRMEACPVNSKRTAANVAMQTAVASTRHMLSPHPISRGAPAGHDEELGGCGSGGAAGTSAMRTTVPNDRVQPSCSASCTPSALLMRTSSCNVICAAANYKAKWSDIRCVAVWAPFPHRSWPPCPQCLRKRCASMLVWL